MNKHRVVVTGMSLLTPIGKNLPQFWENSLQGCSGVSLIDWFDIPDDMSKIAGIIRDFEPRMLSTFEYHSKSDRALLFAVETARNALIDAGYIKNNACLLNDSDKSAIYLSSAVSQLGMMERIFCLESQKGLYSLKPMTAPRQEGYNAFLFNDLTHKLAQKIGFTGRKLLIPTGCAGGLDAIGYSMQAIRNGKVDVVVTGAVEAPITPLVVAAFSKINATSRRFNHAPSKASRPFDSHRDGFVLGEGCGILILESYEHAAKRNAHIYAELIGTASVNNALHMTDMPENGESIAKSCQLAIKDAGIKPDQIDFINAHGSSTPQNDAAEACAYRTILGDRLDDIPVTSIKSQIGHAFAASNSIEVISAILSMKDNIIPPTINLENQDEKCHLNVVANKARQASVNCILKTSSGFSGIHSSLIIQRFQE